MSISNRFIEFAMHSGALWISKDATRKLKSGRMSPYFFNSGDFSSGQALSEIGHAFAVALHRPQHRFDVLFGPAYKGIALAAVTAAALYELDGVNVECSSNRKETKDHGEGGDLIGASLQGKRVFIIDDVTTRGDAKREAVGFISNHGGIPVGIAIAFDRQERGVDTELSAVQQLENEFHIPVRAIATAQDLINYLSASGKYPQELAAIERYLGEYGVGNEL